MKLKSLSHANFAEQLLQEYMYLKAKIIEYYLCLLLPTWLNRS